MYRNVSEEKVSDILKNVSESDIFKVLLSILPVKYTANNKAYDK